MNREDVKKLIYEQQTKLAPSKISGAVQDMCGEDVSFCLDAIEKGFDIWCDPRIRVGHEKTRII